MRRKLLVILAIPAVAAGVVFASCHTKPVEHISPATHVTAGGSSTTQASQGRSPYADVAADDLRDTLSGLARAHSQKTELSFWVSTPLKSVSAPFKPFFANMGKTQGELSKMLADWAKQHQVDLTFSFEAGTAGEAEKIMEARQEKIVRGDSRTDFERDILIQMFMDYEWQVSEIEALMPKVQDPGLKAYLQRSLQVHEAGSREIAELLKGYKFSK